MNHLEKNVFSTTFPKDFIGTLPKFEYYGEQDSQQLLLNLHLVMTVLESWWIYSVISFGRSNLTD